LFNFNDQEPPSYAEHPEVWMSLPGLKINVGAQHCKKNSLQANSQTRQPALSFLVPFMGIHCFIRLGE
jgi:hypothetical protein